MKILLLITKSNWGGAQRYVFDLATHLPTDRYEVTVALGGTGEKRAETGILEQKLRTAGIRALRIKNFMRNMSFLQDVRAFFEVYALLQKERPHVIHANSSKAGGIGMLCGFLTRVPVRVFTVHGFAFNESRSWLATSLIRLASWCTILFATKAICVGKTDANIASRWPFVGKKVSYISLGLAPHLLLEKKHARTFISTQHAHIELWLGSIAELHPNKGLRYAIQGCALLRDRGKKFIYIIIGAGQEETILRELIHQHQLDDVVILKGHVSDAAQYLKAFDIFLLPSIKEGLPYVILETAAASVPVVASAIPSLTDILVNDRTALLTPPRDPRALAHMLETLMDSPARRHALGSTLHKYVVQTYSLTTMIEKTIACYTPKNSLSADSRGTVRA